MSMSEKRSLHINELGEEGEVIIIPPSDELRKKAVKDGSPSNAYNRAIKAAEEAIEQLSSEFGNWINMELERLLDVLALIRKDGWKEDHAQQLFLVAHDLKGQAATLGYPTITEICDTLCNLLENIPDTQRLSVNVVEIFITSIKTIIEQCERNEDNPKATAISLGLRQMALKILQHEKEHNDQLTENSAADTNQHGAQNDADAPKENLEQINEEADEVTSIV